MKVRQTAVMMVLGLCFASGCYSFRSQMAEDWIAYRNYQTARQAWISCRDVYIDCEPNLHDFGLGFRAGYQNIAGGGNGCPPTLPPQRYWTARFQDDCGKEQVVAWYNGWSHGVELALSDGMAGSSKMVTSLDLYPQCQATTEIALPDPHAIEPMPTEAGGWDGEGLVPAPEGPGVNPPPAVDLY